MIELRYLRSLPCEQIAPVLQEFAQNSLELLQRQVADVVEQLFQKKGERTLIFGCMHYEASASELFLQTQTPVYDLLPQNVCGHGEDHSHRNAVTVDLRVSPDENNDLPLDTNMTLNTTSHQYTEIGPNGPDFARRNIKIPSHLDDFKCVKDVEKIYVERMPFLEKGPFAESSSNIHFFKTIHKLLGSGGILSFDYVPLLAIFNNGGAQVTYCHSAVAKVNALKITISDQEISNFLQNSPYSEFLKKITKVHVAIAPSLQCPASCKPCSTNTPCSQVAFKVAKSALKAKKEAVELGKFLNTKREEIEQREKAVLTEEEIYIGVNKRTIPLQAFKQLSAEQLPLVDFAPNMILIKCHPDRTEEEMESLDFQVESYRALNVAPDLLDQLDPETKRVLDLALVTLVNKVVFPQLRLLNFDRVSFDPNGQNPENKRPYERVIYARKLEVV